MPYNTLRRRLEALKAEQAVLMEQALALPEDMENEELNAQLKAISEEKEDILHQLGAHRQADEHKLAERFGWIVCGNLRSSGKRNLRYMMTPSPAKFVEQITVLNAEAIRIKFRYPGLEVDKSLN